MGTTPFIGCSGLNSIVVESGNTTYDSRDNCNAIILSEINQLVRGCNSTVIPDGVTSIGYSAFSGCIGLSSITIPNSVTSIGSGAFSGCSGLTSINISDGVISIGDYTFRNCSSLISITIPNGVTSIGYNAFEGCSGLESITIPDNVISIGISAFYNCSGLTSATIGSGVTKIYGNAFSGCSSLTDLYCRALNVPEAEFVSIDRRGNKSTSNAFNGFNTNNATLHVPLYSLPLYQSTSPWNTFGSIVALPKDEVEVDEKFTRIISFADPKVKASLVSEFDLDKDGEISEGEAEMVSDELFAQCSFDKVIVSFNEMPYFTKIKAIPANMFKDCASLTSLTIPDGVTSIGGSAFSGCTSLTSLTIPSGVKSISEFTFFGCTSLSSLTIPSGVTSIGVSAFSGCTSLNSLNIPSSVTSVGNYAFSGCSITITRFTYTDDYGLRKIYDYENLSGIVGVTIADNVTTIPDYQFNMLSSLKSVTIGKGVTSIGDYAFDSCSGLKSVTIGSGVTSIGNYAFSNCRSLAYVICQAGEVPKANKFSDYYYTFDDLAYKNAMLYVPAASFNLYKLQEPWSKFESIQPIEGDVDIPEIQTCAKPTISVVDGNIHFSCETEDVQFVSTIQVSDAKSYTTSDITLSQTYKVTVYAKKKGYYDSETVQAEFKGSLIRGDLNGDGGVNVADHVELSKIILGK